MNASFEARPNHVLASGARLYLVSLHLASPNETFERPTYLLQLGLSTGPASRLTLLQQDYHLDGQSLHLIGIVPGDAMLAPDRSSVQLQLTVDGELIAVTLPRQPADRSRDSTRRRAAP